MQTLKRGLALLIVLVMCVSFLPALQLSTSAAEVSYVYDGKYIYNWGTRGVTATFLSPNAEAFYTGNNTYDVLSSYAGGTGTSNAPSSALYKALQNLMKNAHSHTTSYNETRDLYKYTDSQANGSNGGKISSFYSGVAIGPDWDSGSTWNREHTWPNSKGLNGDDENDIMMLRPTASSENFSRGNKAYGQSSGYYHPNSESNGDTDVRGDVARIFLYVYVRWGNVSGNGEHATWGSDGVMESLDVLLEWMEADPVDTWELGRNDSVQSITGTRNVFVDYPELAFLLFGEDIPADMKTPSGAATETCDHNNFDAGVVFAATCTERGYTLYTCRTAGCGYSYRASFVEEKGHNYVSGICSVCGEAQPVEPAKPTYVTEISVGTAYKLGFYSTNKSAEYYFSGTMNGYYGATDTAYANGVDVYVESTTGGYYLYFKNSSNQKQYINLVHTGEHYNFTFNSTPTSVFAWDETLHTLTTTVNDEVCWMGTYGSYFTMSVLRSSKQQDTDYVARLYTFAEDGGETPDAPCAHNYIAVVTAPTCLKGGFTTYTCSLCADSYTGNAVAANGHNYQNAVCIVCGAEQPSGTKVTISFTDDTNRTVCTTSQQVWVQNGITVTNDKGSSTSNVADYKNPARFYKSSNLTIAYPGMTRIEINCQGLDSKYVSGWLDVPAGATATNTDGIITIVFDKPVDSIVYTKLSAQCRAYDIAVYAEVVEDIPSCTHTELSVVGAIAATCTNAGHTGKTVCLACGETMSEGREIPAPGHNKVLHGAQAPTCTAYGWEAYEACSGCDYTTYVEIPAKGHILGDWVQTVAPNGNENGEERRDCNACDYYETREIEVGASLKEFVAAVENLSENASAEVAYGEIYEALKLYAKLTDEEKALASDSFALLQDAMESYNSEAGAANNALAEATEIAFLPISASFAFVAALWFLLKKKFML